MKLVDLAARLGCRLEGDGAIEIVRVCGLEEAGPGDVTFLANPRYAPLLATTRASAVIVADDVTTAPCATLRTSHPYLAFADAVAALAPPRAAARGISALACIDPTADLGADVVVGPYVVIGAGARIGARTEIRAHAVVGAGAVVGRECLVHAHASIREHVTLGDRVVLQDHAVIGSDGFGFAKRPDGTHQKIPQVGTVIVGDDVEIGAHTAVDRPAFGATRIAPGAKIDNLVQIAHGVKIGRNVLLAAQVGIAGSSVIEDDAILAGQVGVINHVRVGAGAILNSKSAVMRDIPAGQHSSGIPAIDVESWREGVAILRRLPELRKRIAALDARLAAIEDAVRKSTV